MVGKHFLVDEVSSGNFSESMDYTRASSYPTASLPHTPPLRFVSELKEALQGFTETWIPGFNMWTIFDILNFSWEFPKGKRQKQLNIH